MSHQIKCHYEVLDVPRDADTATIKKSHRKLALRHHPDKNIGKSEEEQEQSALQFKLIQAAYECLSDGMERKWYDEHRGMILSGGMNRGGGAEDGADGSTFLFDVMPYQYAGCYDGYDDDDPDSFYSVYGKVFEEIFQGEKDGFISEGNIDLEDMSNFDLSEVHMGNSTSKWEDVLAFYNTWEGFTSCLSFAWVDVYHFDDIREAPSRRIRRLMEDDNKKKRKGAKKERVGEVSALLRFVKKRDQRLKIQREKSLREQTIKEAERKKEAVQRKKDIAAAKEEWRAEAERTMAEQETVDLNAGRIRLADLDSDDDYDYGGGKRGRKKKGKKRGKGKKGGKKNTIEKEADLQNDIDDLDNTNGMEQDETIKDESGVDQDDDEKKDETHTLLNAEVDLKNEEIDAEANVDDELGNEVANLDLASSEESSEEEEEEPTSWRCEICRKEFKSLKQFENHLRSKKHKEMVKKNEKKMKKLKEEAEKEALRDMIDDLDDEE